MKTNPSTTTIGIDLGDKKHSVCALDASGSIIYERSITNHRESLRRLSSKYPGALIAMEVGTHSPWTSRFLSSLGHEVIVANPRKLRAIYANTRKSDRQDACILARLARVDRKLLHPIKHGSEEAQQDLLQVKLRDNLVSQRVNVINSVRMTLKSLGIRLPKHCTAVFTKRCRQHLTGEHAGVLAMIEPSLDVIDSLSSGIAKFDKTIDETCSRYPVTSRLMEIRGVGPITALTFVLVIDNAERFTSARNVPAYLGLVPRRDQSGDVDKQLRISKAGNAYLRRLLVSAAQYLLGPFGTDCDLRRQGLRLASMGGARAKKKAVVAVARKLAVLMYTLWRRELDYDPLHLANQTNQSDGVDEAA
jgi:transposase